MAFKFRYESLLVYRNHLKEKAEMGLARATRELRISEQCLADLNQDRVRAASELQADLGVPMEAGLMRSYMEYLGHLTDQIRAKATEVTSRESAVREERKQLLSRAKECRIMDNLKEKDRVKWKMEQERKERLRLNEIAVLRHRIPRP
jgi:flagellar export protein FliJ